MTAAGTLAVQVYYDGRVVKRVSTASQRPQASRLLKGQTARHAQLMVPLLFGICSQAQHAAACTAIAAAGGAVAAQPVELEQAVRRETLQEHLWRLLLDWPQLLGLPPLQELFVRWHGELRQPAALLPSLQAEIEREWLGMPAAEWLALQQWQDVQRWWQQGTSPAAQLMKVLDAAEAGLPAIGTPLLPMLTAKAASHAWQAAWSGRLAARPEFEDTACETGALAAYAGEPWLQAVLRQRPARLLARTLCRVREMLELAMGTQQPRIDGAHDGEGAGLALVRTARGLLLHRVNLREERVEDYLIVAPTEWNFHPAGPLAAGLLGLEAPAEDRLVHNVRMLTLSLDPCLEYQIEVCHA